MDISGFTVATTPRLPATHIATTYAACRLSWLLFSSTAFLPHYLAAAAGHTMPAVLLVSQYRNRHNR